MQMKMQIQLFVRFDHQCNVSDTMKMYTLYNTTIYLFGHNIMQLEINQFTIPVS